VNRKVTVPLRLRRGPPCGEASPAHSARVNSRICRVAWGRAARGAARGVDQLKGLSRLGKCGARCSSPAPARASPPSSTHRHRCSRPSAATAAPTNSKCNRWRKHCSASTRHPHRPTPPTRSPSPSATRARHDCCGWQARPGREPGLADAEDSEIQLPGCPSAALGGLLRPVGVKVRWNRGAVDRFCVRALACR